MRLGSASRLEPRTGRSGEGLVFDGVLARRAAGLSTSFPTPHFPSELGEGVVAFDSGFASPEVLPDLTTFAMAALTTHRDETLQYSANQGQPELRRWIADYMNEDGCDLTPDHLMIVNGAKDGLDLVCRLLLDPGDAVVVTAPTYFTCIPIFRSFEAQLLEVAQDDDGIRVDELEALLDSRAQDAKRPHKFVYVVADYHNPAGVSISAERRQALVALAAKRGFFIVEDNPYRRVRFEGPSIPTLKALDREGVVIHTGTFSKLIAPGLRIGWVAAEPELIARLLQLKSDGGTSALLQRIVYEFCRSPAFPDHVERVRRLYVTHRDRMVAAIRREMPDVGVNVPHGGYYLWLTLPASVDGEALARAAAAASVNLIPGSKFYAGTGGFPRNRDDGRSHVRLSYSFATVDDIDEGVSRLARIYQAMRAA